MTTANPYALRGNPYAGVRARIDALVAAEDAGDLPEMVLFWGHDPDQPLSGHGCCSQWWPSPIVVDGTTYATAEHWMMAAKAALFDDLTAWHRIMEMTDPAEAKRIGRAVDGYDERAWAAARYGVVLHGNLAKFTQHRGLREILMGTGDALIVEASPYDRVWGVGRDPGDPDARRPSRWRGLNLLGFVLMDVRERLA